MNILMPFLSFLRSYIDINNHFFRLTSSCSVFYNIKFLATINKLAPERNFLSLSHNLVISPIVTIKLASKNCTRNTFSQGN